MAISTSNEDILMYKNRLQEYTQKLGLPLPSYKNVNEGLPHSPSFRSTVLVDGRTYEAKCTFPTRKQAEQEAARLALESLSKQINDTGSPTIYTEPRFCKSLLYQYALKNNLGMPSFKTINPAGPCLVYLSYMVFGGKTYTGEVAGSKKMAEQLAARVAIRSLLETDAERMSNIIKSNNKHDLYSLTRKEKDHAFSDKSKDSLSKQLEKAPENSPLYQASIQVSKNLLQGQTSSQTATVSFNSYGTVGGPRKELTCKPEISTWEQNKMGETDYRNVPDHKPQINNWVQNAMKTADRRNGQVHKPGPGTTRPSNWEQNKTVVDMRNGPKRKLESNNWNLIKKKNLGS
ncbi:double-stranded RNA-binding protein 4-like isoform X2 [Ipomoea triloba]|uniref:double-stranded RNA-binding protein 4-like isoform X2 n=1 Tax=Ipomoea triloba TaxID=35885 RepID=UPI00125D3623|nr:double-stranded RNA-binding protein 4-like isoform X2 [Ipomoea triloba]